MSTDLAIPAGYAGSPVLLGHLPIVLDQADGPDWALFRGDCCEVLKGLPPDSIHFGVHSPPFANLYIYSDSEVDMGNCEDMGEFLTHYRYAIREMLRVTIPGRLVAVHCKDLPLYRGRDGEAGLVDFPGAIVRAYVDEGWTFHSRITIWKCPVTERERTNNNGLLHKTVCRDSSQLRQGMADFLLVFRKTPPEDMLSAEPIVRPAGLTEYEGTSDPRQSSYHPSKFARVNGTDNDSITIWRRYAEPVWWDVDQMDVLNYRAATDPQDERHICPLQLGVIRRAIALWTNPGDVVLDPFNGIGSTGVGAIELGRKYLGIELKDSYFGYAVRQLTIASNDARQRRNTLFDREEIA